MWCINVYKGGNTHLFVLYLTMSRLVKCQWTFFELFLSKTSNKQRQVLLDTITKDQLRAFVQIVLNFLQRTITVSSSVLTTLERHKRLLRRLVDTSLALVDKRKILKGRAKAVYEFLKAVKPSLNIYLQ